MRKIILILGLLSFSAFGTIPETAEGWYLPPEGWNPTETKAYWKKNDIEYYCKINEEGAFDKYPPGVSEAERLALGTAVSAFHETKWNQKRIEVIGENLHKVFATDGITITGETPDGSTDSYTIKFSSGIGESETIQGETDHMKWNLADEKSLHLLQGNKIQIKGWHLSDSSTSFWDYSTGAVMVRLNPDGKGVHYFPYRGVDKRSLVPDPVSKKLQLSEWDTAPANGMLPLSEALLKDKKNIYSDYKLVVRNSSKGMNYVDIGTLSIGNGAPVDGTSITTNESSGAVVQGEASLYGWSTADNLGLPYKSEDGKLAWKPADEWVDGASLAFADIAGEKKFEVKDAHVYAGNHSKHYFGTSNDKTATLGWHELPNVTTNRVEGDNLTIASTADEQDPGLKRIGLRGWNKSWGGDPLFVVNAGGSIAYIPLPAITNLAACACSNKWENAAKWIGGAEIAEDGGLTLPEESLDKYLYDRLGYIYSTTPANFHFDNDGEQIKASFTAPENWADGTSVELTTNGAYQVAGWANASACSASMSAMLSQPTGSDATTHLLLAKKTNTGELHYVPIGDGVQSGAAVDDTTITTNAAHGAMTQGEASIYGWSSAANDTYLSKNEGGALEWRNIDPVPGVDDASIVTNTAKELTLCGYATADNNAVPMKTEQGLSWLKASSATNLILAGAGINITDNGGGAITISAQSFDDAQSGGSTVALTVITDIRYDTASHKLQVKRRNIVFKGSAGEPPADWEDVFEATSHKEEHGITE